MRHLGQKQRFPKRKPIRDSAHCIRELPLWRFERAMADVAAVVHTFEVDLADGVVSTVEGGLQRVGCRGDSQHTASAGEVVAVDERRASMENLNAGHSGSVVETGDAMSSGIAAGITIRRGDNGGGCAWFPAELGFAEAAFDAALEGVENIAFQADKNGLRLRIAEARVVLE